MSSKAICNSSSNFNASIMWNGILVSVLGSAQPYHCVNWMHISVNCIKYEIIRSLCAMCMYILWFRWVCFYGNECAVSEFTPTRSLSASDYIVHACTPTQSHCQHHFILLIMMRGEKVCSFQDFTWNDFLFCAGNINSQIKEQ